MKQATGLINNLLQFIHHVQKAIHHTDKAINSRRSVLPETPELLLVENKDVAQTVKHSGDYLTFPQAAFQTGSLHPISTARQIYLVYIARPGLTLEIHFVCFPSVDSLPSSVLRRNVPHHKWCLFIAPWTWTRVTLSHVSICSPPTLPMQTEINSFIVKPSWTGKDSCVSEA